MREVKWGSVCKGGEGRREESIPPIQSHKTRRETTFSNKSTINERHHICTHALLNNMQNIRETTSTQCGPNFNKQDQRSSLKLSHLLQTCQQANTTMHHPSILTHNYVPRSMQVTYPTIQTCQRTITKLSRRRLCQDRRRSSKTRRQRGQKVRHPRSSQFNRHDNSNHNSTHRLFLTKCVTSNNLSNHNTIRLHPTVLRFRKRRNAKIRRCLL